ncbi:alpha/beta hydrolase [Verticiella sediminum]|uniref:Alpha/beta hydrolase n=1 Tax=Verticiella sediminum TaxID=1247510 RepID=A0A556AVI8_9BURK|nr:alpha/beta hydrolase [Verticiella sediminum]
MEPPSVGLLMLEARAAAELSLFLATVPLLRLAPAGDGHPVLVLPGLSAGDATTYPLRAFLRDRGYRPHGWKLGPNRGPRPGVEEKLIQRLTDLHERYQRKVSVIGWSLGGVYARLLAHHMPERVRSVVTLGSPFASEPRATNAWRLYELLSGRTVDDWAERAWMKAPPPVPSTAIFSRTDGVVAWRGCMEQESATSENIEVEGSHCGLGHNPAALYAIADRLAQPEGEWTPFQRTGLRRLVYRDPYRTTPA